MFKGLIRSVVLSAAAMTLLTSGIAGAQQSSLVYRLDTGQSTQSIVGITFTRDQPVRISELAAEQMTQGVPIVRIPVEKSARGFAAMVAGLDNGEMIFGDVRALHGGVVDPHSLPECSTQALSEDLLDGQQGLLQSLVTVRSQRRKLFQERVGELLNDDFAQRLSKLESGFGLASPAILSADLEPNLLVERLWQLKTIIQNYEHHKKTRENQ